jgi:hypothetical protein
MRDQLSMSTDAYDEVLSKAQALSADEQRTLVEQLTVQLSTNGQRRRSVLELQGLGKEVWSVVDAQEYVRQEGASWTG